MIKYLHLRHIIFVYFIFLILDRKIKLEYYFTWIWLI